MIDDTSTLTKLGSNKTNYVYEDPNKDILEVFENKFPGRDYEVKLTFPEFTSLCPKTGQPDFAVIHILYSPDRLCLESKSIKMYFFAYRNFGSFMETITNKILNDCVEKCAPRRMKVIGQFNARGGLVIEVSATYFNHEILRAK